mmetsp:Transcript_2061/g.7357  ORF Transcript_2061/g.7357 Transcript_2061/m.7357 type:complete len:201 (-) Transcript_2061:593-1195(-)
MTAQSGLQYHGLEFDKCRHKALDHVESFDQRLLRRHVLADADAQLGHSGRLFIVQVLHDVRLAFVEAAGEHLPDDVGGRPHPAGLGDGDKRLGPNCFDAVGLEGEALAEHLEYEGALDAVLSRVENRAEVPVLEHAVLVDVARPEEQLEIGGGEVGVGLLPGQREHLLEDQVIVEFDHPLALEEPLAVGISDDLLNVHPT